MSRSLLRQSDPSRLQKSPIFSSLQKEIDRVFENFGDLFSDMGDRFEIEKDGRLTPKIDVSETDDAVEISAELPGVEEKDIDVTLSDNMIIIKGETSREKEEKDKDFHLIERSKGQYLRTVPLGFTVGDDKVEATFKDGVLRVTVSKPSEVIENTRKIPIGKAK